MTEARKGDLVLIERTARDVYIGQPSQSRTEFRFAVVGSATRDGVVKTVHRGDVTESASRLYPWERVYVLSAKEIDVAAVLAAAKDHHWPGHPGQPMPFASLEEARECARPFRKAA